jgi:hypothetical protein
MEQQRDRQTDSVMVAVPVNQLVKLRLLPEKVYETISSSIEGTNRIRPECPGDRKDKGHQRLMIGRLVREISCPLSCALPPLT